MINLLKVIFILLVGSSLLAAKDYKKEYHEEFDASKGMKMRLVSGDGDVTIKPATGDKIKVDIIYHADHRGDSSDDRAFNVDFDHSAGALHIVANERMGSTFGISSRHIYEYTYTITAPDYVRLDIEGDDGNVSITGWKSDIEVDIDDGDLELRKITCEETYCRLEDGDISIDNLSSDLSLWCDDGDIRISDMVTKKTSIEVQDGSCTIDNAKGNYSIRFDDGNVNMYQLEANTLDIRGEDGDIEVELINSSESDIRLETKDGSVRLGVNPDISAEISIETDDGSIRTNLSSETKAKEGKNWYYADLNDGKGSITIRTSDGSVKVRDL